MQNYTSILVEIIVHRIDALGGAESEPRKQARDSPNAQRHERNAELDHALLYPQANASTVKANACTIEANTCTIKANACIIKQRSHTHM